MTMTDPIADMLTRVRNANQAYHDTTTMPHSKIKVGIAEILVNEGYIASYTVNEPAEGEVGKTLSITLKYGQNRERSIAGVRRISKPGLRVYAKSNELPKVLGGLGIAIISTSQGLLTDKQAQPHRRRRRSRRLRVVSARQVEGRQICHALAGSRSRYRPASR